MTMRNAFNNSKGREIEDARVDAFVSALKQLQFEHQLQVNVDVTGEFFIEKYDERYYKLLDTAYIMGDV